MEELLTYPYLQRVKPFFSRIDKKENGIESGFSELDKSSTTNPKLGD